MTFTVEKMAAEHISDIAVLAKECFSLRCSEYAFFGEL